MQLRCASADLQSSHSDAAVLVGTDSVRINFDSLGIIRAAVGKDSLFFDLRPLARMIAADSIFASEHVPAEQLHFHAASPTRRALLALQSLFGSRIEDSVRVRGWEGTLFVGKAK